MRIYLFVIVMSLIGCAGKSKHPVVKIPMGMEELERLAFEYSTNKPDSSIQLYHRLIQIYQEEDLQPKIGIAYLNVANIYDEVLGNYSKAKINSDHSLQIWQKLNDSLQMANLYKYLGYLNGKLGDYEVGLQNIEQALSLYSELNYENGTAITYLNLAKLEADRGNYVEAEKHYHKSLNYWLKVNNQSRVNLTRKFGDRLEKLKNQNPNG